MSMIKKTVMVLLAALPLAWASAAYAVDNGTEFGIEDDLTVLGTEGTQADPDVAIKGFSVFGATQTAPALNIPEAPGNIFANGYVQVSSGMYVAGSSTFTAGVYVTGISSFAAGPGSIYVKDGESGQVLKKVAGGGMQWANDNVGLDAAAMGDPRFLQMPNAGQTALEDSKLYQDPNNTSITLMDSSSMTVTGAMAVKGDLAVNADKFQVVAANGNTAVGGTLGAAGLASLDGGIAVDTNKFTVAGDGSGNTAIGGTLGLAGDLAVATNKFNVAALTGDTLVAGTLGLTGAATLSNNLTVNGSAQLGDARTDDHGINVAAEDGVALKVAGEDVSGKYVAKFYSGDPAVAANLAAWIKKK